MAAMGGTSGIGGEASAPKASCTTAEDDDDGKAKMEMV